MTKMLDLLLLLTFVAGLIPAVLFLVLYAARSAWSSTGAGRAMMTLMLVVVFTYLSGVATLVFPEFFRDEPGVLLRIAIRAICAIALGNMCRVLIRAQRDQNSQDRESV